MNYATQIQSGVPVLLLGQPGTGKTSYINSLGKALGLHVETLIGSILEPTDIGGLPFRDNGKVEYAPPGWFARLTENNGGLLFLDELTCTAPATQAGMLRLVFERAIHNRRLPDNTLIVAAANPPDEAAGGWDLAAPLANRFCHLQWELKSEAWVEGMISGWKTAAATHLPETWTAFLPETRSLTASFITTKPANLIQLPKDESKRGQPWPSPRTWDMASRLMAAHKSVGEEDGMSIAGCVGEGAAMEFLTYRKNLDLPNPEDLLADAAKATLPTRDDRLFATLSSVTSAVLARNTPERWGKAWVILKKAADANKADIAAVSARLLASNKPDGAKNPKEVTVFLPILQEVGKR